VLGHSGSDLTLSSGNKELAQEILKSVWTYEDTSRFDCSIYVLLQWFGVGGVGCGGRGEITACNHACLTKSGPQISIYTLVIVISLVVWCCGFKFVGPLNNLKHWNAYEF
jgi:hypothetical protein